MGIDSRTMFELSAALLEQNSTLSNMLRIDLPDIMQKLQKNEHGTFLTVPETNGLRAWSAIAGVSFDLYTVKLHFYHVLPEFRKTDCFHKLFCLIAQYGQARRYRFIEVQVPELMQCRNEINIFRKIACGEEKNQTNFGYPLVQFTICDNQFERGFGLEEVAH